MPFHLSAQTKLDSMQLLKDVRFLSSSNKQAGKKTGNRYCYLEQRFKETGIQPLHKTYQQSFKFTENKERLCGANLIGKIKGATDSILVISIYYNYSLPANASGVAALLATADYFKQHRPFYTLLLVILDGDIAGQGAAAFLKHPPVSFDKIKFNISIGEMGNNDNHQLAASLPSNSSELEKILRNMDKNTSIHLVQKVITLKENEAAEKKQMSEYSFLNNLVPFVYFHSEDQNMNGFNPSFFYPAVQVIKSFAKKINTSGFLKNQIPPKSKWIMKSRN